MFSGINICERVLYICDLLDWRPLIYIPKVFQIESPKTDRRPYIVIEGNWEWSNLGESGICALLGAGSWKGTMIIFFLIRAYLSTA